MSAVDFWGLVVQSRLLTREHCDQLAEMLLRTAPTAATDPQQIAKWLVAEKLVSRYQATILLGGRPGPFFYGDYKVYDRVEKGRLAGWFRAVHAATNHPVSLKFLTGEAAQDVTAWTRILHALPTFSHPHVVRGYEGVDLAAYKFLVMEDLRGKALAEPLAGGERLPVPQACLVARQAAAGLLGLEQHGRIHGDIRPKNIWLIPSGLIKLLVDPEFDPRTSGQFASSSDPEQTARADYLAPEFLRSGKTPDTLTDIYALGCVLYEMLAGQPPFPGGSAVEKLQRHAQEPIRPLAAYGVPPGVAQVVAFMMAKNPSVRFQNPQLIVDQLASFVEPSRLHVPVTPEPPTAAAYEPYLKHAAVQQTGARPPSSAGAGLTPIGGGPVGTVGGAGVGGPGRVPLGSPTSPQVAIRTQGSGAPRAAQPVFPDPQGGRRVGPVGPTAPTPGIGAPAGTNFPLSPAAPPARSTNPKAVVRKARARAERQKMIGIGLSLGASVLALALVALVIVLWPSKEANQAGQELASKEVLPDQDRAAGGSVTPGDGAGRVDRGNAAQAAATRGASNRPEASSPTEAAASPTGDVLWASPTTGQPVVLDLLPSGAQTFVILRPAALLGVPEGQRVLRALGPDFQTQRADWEKAAGLPWEEIEQLVIGVYANGGEPPRISCVVRPRQARSTDEWLAAWGSPSQVGAEGKTFYQGTQWAYLIPSGESQAFVMGNAVEIKDLAENPSAPPLLRREIGQLLRVSDADRHVTILFAPNFLFADGKPLFAGERAKAVEPLRWFLGDSLKAGLLSFHFDPQFYLELRMESDIVLDRYQLASQVRDRMKEIPSAMETYLANLNPHPYWRIVANRYPLMVGFLHQNTRIGVAESHAVLNAVLPQVAAHNLIFGGEMVLVSTPGAAPATVAAAAADTGPKTIEEVLNAKISLSFDQDSFEFSVRNVVNEVTSAYKLPFEFDIRIIGDDLKLDGITRNQQIRDFRQADKTVAEVLTALVMKANPVTTVKTPDEKDQKLLWVIAPDPDNPNRKIILVTVRQVAEAKYTLPEIFKTK